MEINWNAISAIANSVSALAVFLTMLRLSLAKRVSQLQFEDNLEKEYREIAARIPTEALVGGGLSPQQYKAASEELFRHFDLTNKQVMLRKKGRIRDSTWGNWLSGIKFNLSLPVFKKNWFYVKDKTDLQKSEFFGEFRKPEETNFQCDPKS